MSHTRFALGFPRHRKVFALSDVAFRLWISAMDHARDQGRDGSLEPIDLDLIPRCPPAGKKRDAVVAELVSVGLWDTTSGGWQIHDYLDWQDGSEAVREKRARARERMRAVRANKSRTSETRSSEVHVGESLPPPSSSSDRSQTPEGVQGESPAEDRETVCPLDLASRAEKLGIPEQFAKSYGVSLEAVRAQVRETESFWTIGGGAGKRRKNWMLVVRNRLHELGKAGGLVMPAGAPVRDPEALRRRREAADKRALEERHRDVRQELERRGIKPVTLGEAVAEVTKLVEGA